MHKLLRFYNQNRIKIWVVILGIIFILLVIQIFDSVARSNREEQNRKILENEITVNNDVSYEIQSESIISDEDVPKLYREDFGNVIDNFFTYCIQHEPRKAYNLLSQETIDTLYPTVEIFEDLYYKEKFEGNKDFSFQSWITSGNLYIYQIKIFDNILATGRANETYYEDYVTIVPEDGEYKLNINNLIGLKNIYQTYSSDGIDIRVKKAQTFMSYEIYTFDITNNTDNVILIDSRVKTDSVYLVDKVNNRYSALLYENSEEELVLQPGEKKEISIKFSDVYREGIVIEQIYWTDIILNYETYVQGNQVERMTLKIEL